MERNGQRLTPPEQIAAAKRLIDAGWRVERLQERSYQCFTCGLELWATSVPRGWYALTRHTGMDDRPRIRLGLFCSIACLDEQIARLDEVEHETGDQFDYSPYLHDRAAMRARRRED